MSQSLFFVRIRVRVRVCAGVWVTCVSSFLFGTPGYILGQLITQYSLSLTFTHFSHVHTNSSLSCPSNITRLSLPRFFLEGCFSSACRPHLLHLSLHPSLPPTDYTISPILKLHCLPHSLSPSAPRHLYLSSIHNINFADRSPCRSWSCIFKAYVLGLERRYKGQCPQIPWNSGSYAC